MEFVVVIPARYASSRLPGKVLLSICGRPMLEHVYEHALESGAGRVFVAAEEERVAETARSFGAEVIMTASTHRSGTERAAEVIERLALPD